MERVTDDTPTLPLPSATTPLSTVAPGAPRPSRPSRAPLIAFVIVAVLVVAASGLLAFILLTRAGQSPAAAASSTPPPTNAAPTSAAPIATPLPPGQFTRFDTPKAQQCRGRGKDRQPVAARVSWATVNATEVWVTEGTADAVTAGQEQAPVSGNQDALPDPLLIDCSKPTMTFTMTLVGRDGAHVSHTWTVATQSRH